MTVFNLSQSKSVLPFNVLITGIFVPLSQIQKVKNGTFQLVFMFELGWKQEKTQFFIFLICLRLFECSQYTITNVINSKVYASGLGWGVSDVLKVTGFC